MQTEQFGMHMTERVREKIRFLLTANTRFKMQIMENVSIAMKKGHWKRNCLKYLAEKKVEKAQQGKYDLLVVKICLVEYDYSP